MVTVTRIVIRMPTIPVTVGILGSFDICDRKNGDSYEDCDQHTHDLCDCWHF